MTRLIDADKLIDFIDVGHLRHSGELCYSEVDVETGDTIMSNIADPQTVDVFKYTVTSSSIAGIFTEGSMLSYRGTTVPAGWLLPFTYVRNMAHVRLIVPSKMGHSTAQQYVTPYYYDLAKLQIYK